MFLRSVRTDLATMSQLPFSFPVVFSSLDVAPVFVVGAEVSVDGFVFDPSGPPAAPPVLVR